MKCELILAQQFEIVALRVSYSTDTTLTLKYG